MAMEVKNYGEKNEIVIADGIFESGKVIVEGGAKIVRGDLLSRNTDGDFVAFTGADGQTVVAIWTKCDELDGGDKGETYSDRVLISGVVKADAVKVQGGEATPSQRDLAKAAGIVSVKVTEQRVEDNQ